VAIIPRRRGKSQFQRAADGSMTLMEHFRELRSRLMRASLAVLAGFGVGWWLSAAVLSILQSPYCQLMETAARKRNGGVLPAGYTCPFIQLGVTDTFVLKMKIALWIGLIVAAPIWLYQLWAFIAPGLHRNERRWAYGFAAVATPLFAAGAVLAYFVVAKGLAFLLQFNGPNVTTQLEITRYVDFVTGLMLLFGIAFLFPIVVMLFNFTGLASARRLLGWWRIAVAAFFIFAAVATPTADPFGMTFLALALSALYFGAVGVAFINDRRRRRNLPDYSGLDDDEISPMQYGVDPIEAGDPVDGLEPIGAPEPIAKPLPLDRRYDEST
jgi:sec-independent protein translocase protein TatC